MAVYHVYILASASGVLYTGITNFLERRLAQHKAKLCPGFTAAYDVTRLVYFEPFTDVRAAISRKNKSRTGAAKRSWRLSGPSIPHFVISARISLAPRTASRLPPNRLARTSRLASIPRLRSGKSRRSSARD